MALTRDGNAQLEAALNAMTVPTAGNVKDYVKHINQTTAKINQLSINIRRHLFATTGNNAMLQLALREPLGLYLAYMLEQHANDPSLPLDVDFILRYSRDHPASEFISYLTSPLWLAACDEKVSVVALLLAHGADANDKLADQTPLHACLFQPNRPADTLRIADMLMEHNADLTCTSRDGITPLMLAAGNHPSLVTIILERLRAAGHDVSKYVQACDSNGRTALHYATGGNRNARLRHADVNVVMSLCKEGADLYTRDYEGSDAIMSSCYWLNENSQSVHWTARHVWSRIHYWIDMFQPSLVRQWQVWELVGAQASLDQQVTDNDEQDEDEEELEVKNHTPVSETPNETDEITFYERALTIRQQLSPEDILPIPVIPLFAIYVEPLTVEALRQLRDDYSLMLQHAVQVKRRHLGDSSLAVSTALDKYAEYLERNGSSQRAYECRIMALKLRPNVRELLRIKAADEQRLQAFLDSIEWHISSAHSHLSSIYKRQSHQLGGMPVQGAEWNDVMAVVQAAVDDLVLTDTIDDGCDQSELTGLLLFVTRYLGPLNEQRTANLQHIVDGLAIDNPDMQSRSQQQTIFFRLFSEVINSCVEYIEYVDSDSENEAEGDNREEYDGEFLSPDGVVFVVRAARHGGVSLDPPLEENPKAPKARESELEYLESLQLDSASDDSDFEAIKPPLFLCANILKKRRRTITEHIKNFVRRVMELLVDEGGAHWDAADNTHNTAVCHFDSVTVSRYMNLQCLAARVISAHVTDYDTRLPPSLANFVKLH